MPRKREGTVIGYQAGKGGAQGHYVVRVSANDGSRPLVHLDPGPESKPALEKAKEAARHYTERFAREGICAVPRKPKEAKPGPGETVSAYALRWFADRERRGLTSVRTDRARFKTWVEPRLGPLPIAGVSTLDVKRLVEDLDAAVQGGELAWKTATNVWGLVSKLFDDAKNAKTVALIARADNPTADVRGPDRGDDVSKVFLYPSVFLKLVSSEETPIGFARIAALAVYALPRSAELRGLMWEDVDLAHRRLHVHRTIDNKGEKGSTKGGRGRRVEIEAELVPMLSAMRKESGGEGYVFPDYPSESHLAKALRGYLQRAGVDQAELFTTTATRRQLRFHDLKGTGVTWRAVRGDEPLRIMADAAHRDFKTTMVYVNDAHAMREGFGDVFPPLPPRLSSVSNVRPIRQLGAKPTESLCEEGDLNALGEPESPENEANPPTTATAVQARHEAKSADPGRLTIGDDASRDPLTDALARALDAAREAGDWATLRAILDELKARREASAGNVVSIAATRRGGAS